MSANADTSARADNCVNAVSGQTAIDAAPVKRGDQSECFEFTDCRADCQSLKSAALRDVGLCGGRSAVSRISEQAQPYLDLSGRQMPHRTIDEVIQDFEPLP